MEYAVKLVEVWSVCRFCRFCEFCRFVSCAGAIRKGCAGCGTLQTSGQKAGSSPVHLALYFALLSAFGFLVPMFPRPFSFFLVFFPTWPGKITVMEGSWGGQRSPSRGKADPPRFRKANTSARNGETKETRETKETKETGEGAKKTQSVPKRMIEETKFQKASEVAQTTGTSSSSGALRTRPPAASQATGNGTRGMESPNRRIGSLCQGGEGIASEEKLASTRVTWMFSLVPLTSCSRGS